MWIMNLRVMVYDMKDLGDTVESWIHSPHSHAHFLESWKKLLEAKKAPQKNSKGLSQKVQKNSQNLTLNFYLNLNY